MHGTRFDHLRKLKYDPVAVVHCNVNVHDHKFPYQLGPMTQFLMQVFFGIACNIIEANKVNSV
jgi:hypothetical protein